MVSMETDVEELLALVVNTGRQHDDQVYNYSYHSVTKRYYFTQIIFLTWPNKFWNIIQVIELTQMSELVQKGIVQADEDLRRENDEAVWQEGLLRHVPIVGGIYNWINPLQKVK